MLALKLTPGGQPFAQRALDKAISVQLEVENAVCVCAPKNKKSAV